MNYLVLIHYEAEVYRRSSEAGGDESCIVENLCMVLYVTCIATPLWRHNDSSVTKSTQNMNANINKLEIIWIGFVNCASKDFDEIYVNSNKNSGSIMWERAFWIIASHGYTTLRNTWLWYFRNFIIVVTGCGNDWILELFSNFRALCESMHDFSCIVEITIATATPTML